MPKRKYVSLDDNDKLCKKLEQLERKLYHKKRRRRRLRVLSSSSDEDDSYAYWSQYYGQYLIYVFYKDIAQGIVVSFRGCLVPLYGMWLTSEVFSSPSRLVHTKFAISRNFCC